MWRQEPHIPAHMLVPGTVSGPGTPAQSVPKQKHTVCSSPTYTCYTRAPGPPPIMRPPTPALDSSPQPHPSQLFQANTSFPSFSPLSHPPIPHLHFPPRGLRGKGPGGLGFHPPSTALDAEGSSHPSMTGNREWSPFTFCILIQITNDKWNITCHISKQRMSQSSALQPSNVSQ